jgi:predicted CoA-binding protein
MNKTARIVAVLGASPKPNRHAYKAMQMLLQHGFDAVPVNPAFAEVLGQACRKSVAEVPQPIDTVTLYLGSGRSDPLIESIVHAKPKRIIFNPGAENDRLEKRAAPSGIETVHGCTLIMLQTGVF